MSIKISIIIPMYNAEKYIDDCLNSILSQSLKEFEVIIINDGSTDNSLIKVQKYTFIDKRIKIINKKNEGVSISRNLGVKIAQGEYLIFLDADDFLEKNCLSELYYIAKIKNSDVIIFNTKLKKNKKEIIWKDTDLKGYITYKDYMINYFWGNSISSVCNKFWKKKLFTENKISFPQKLSYGEDGVTLIQLLFHANNIFKLEKEFYYYRVNIKSAMNKKEKPILQYLDAYNYILSFFNERKVVWSQEYLYNFKLNFVYSHLLKYNYFSKKNDDVKRLYFEFLIDIKKIKKIHKNRGIINNYKFIMYKSYQLNIFLGELFKILYNSLYSIKKGVDYYF